MPQMHDRTSIAPFCLAKRAIKDDHHRPSCTARAFQTENGQAIPPEATSKLETSITSPSPTNGMGARKPRILLLADRPGWAFDIAARALSRYLGNEFDFKLSYVIDRPNLHTWPFDLLYVFFWGETYHTQFISDPRRVIKEVASHRWGLEERYGCVTPAQMINRYLADAGTVTAVSKRLQQVLAPHREVLFAPNGFEPQLFFDRGRRRGALKIGWAGNASDPCKGLNDILRPATEGDFELHMAGGDLDHAQMADFYNGIDVLCVASTAEGEPLTLLEAMACGCFPVCVDVGIVPELVTHRQNGLIVNRSVAAFRAALQWCALNLDGIREAGRQNARRMRQLRRWDQVIPHWRAAFQQALNRRGTASSSDATLPPEASEARPVHSPSPSACSSDQQVIAKAKATYYAHFKTMNPKEATDNAYQGCLFYYNAELLPLLPADKGVRVLDVGSGFGYLLKFLVDHGYRRVGGVEIDETLYKISQKYVGHQVEFIIHEDALLYLEKNRSKFDMITCFDLIEHFTLSDALALTIRIQRSLKDGGIAVFRTPNMANILGIYSRYMDLTHQTGFTEYSLTQLLMQADFSEVQLHLPHWDDTHPLTPRLRESAAFHRTLFASQDRVTPKCFEKNLIMWARKAL
jgi:2-polyprenyl-3-methyl-5-hydroxy-6-metoxy-1,4-benzoquinol methylase